MSKASRALVISSPEGHIHSNRVTQRVGSPYPTGQGIGSRILDSRSGRRARSPQPRDNKCYINALAARAARALGQLDEKISTNAVKIGEYAQQVHVLELDM